MEITKTLRNKYRRGTFYSPWRKLREQQQLSKFHDVLDNYSKAQTEENSPYSVDYIRESLAAKRESRRTINCRKFPPNIVAFGTNDWEQYGLWPSFDQISNFRLFDYREWMRLNNLSKISPTIRKSLCEAFLACVKTYDQNNPVNLVFFYADSKFIAPDLIAALRKMGIWVVLLGLDDKHRFKARNQFGMRIGQETLASEVDLVWTTWKTGALIYLAMGATSWYAPEAAAPSFFHSIECERDLDIIFLGQSYGYRVDLVRYLRERGFHLDVFGTGWPSGYVQFEDMIKLYSRAKVVLGIGGVQSMAGVQHLKGRDFEVPMCGTLYLTSYNPELTDWFDIGREILCYSSPQNCAEILHWILRNPNKQREIRQAAQKRSLLEHTWKKRLLDLFDLFPTALE